MILTPSLFSQDIFLGAKAGLNLTNITSENTDEFEQKTGFHAGISSEFSFSEYFSSQIEILYSTRGASAADVAIATSYLSLPVMIKVYPIESLSLDIGPQFSYLIENTATQNNGSAVEASDYEDLDIGLVAGFTYKTNIDLYIQARYVMGITEFDSAGKWKNQVFQFSLGYNFL